MVTNTPGIPLEEEPKRIPFVEIPKDGMSIRYGDGHEEYLRSCPNCGHRLEVSSADGRMAHWFCPVAEGSHMCNFPREPIAKMSKALAGDVVDVYEPEQCHLCNETNLIVDIHRRRERIELMVHHPKGHACKAVRCYIFHTYNSTDAGIQNWDKDPGKFDKDALDKLDEVTSEEAEEMLRKRNLSE